MDYHYLYQGGSEGVAGEVGLDWGSRYGHSTVAAGSRYLFFIARTPYECSEWRSRSELR